MASSTHDPPARETSEPRLGRAAYRLGRLVGRAQYAVERVPPWSVLGLLILANWGVAAEVARIAQHDGPLFYHGGDGTTYYTSAWMMGQGLIPFTTIGYGYPILLAPIAAVAGPNLLAGLPGIIAFNQLVLAPVALLCVYGIARMLAGRAYAYLATLLWVVFPVAVIHYFLPDYHSRYVDLTLPSALGLTPLGDFPSMVVLLVAAYFTLRLAFSGGYPDALAAGFATGLAVVVKPANLLFVPAPVLALLVARRFRGLAVMAAATLPSLIGGLTWKHRGLGYFPGFTSAGGSHLLVASVALSLVAINLHPYIHLDWSHLHHNLDGLREYTWSQRLIYFTAAGGLVGLARRSTVIAVLAATWLGSYLVVKGSAPNLDIKGGGFFTHLIAAFPAYFLLVISLPFLIPFYGRRRTGQAPAPAGGRRLPVVAAAVLGVVSVAGALTVAVLPTTTEAHAALTDSHLVVPLDRFDLTATPAGRGVRLSWAASDSHGDRSSYGILRSPGSTDSDCYRQAGTSGTCNFSGKPVGQTAAGTTTFLDRPPPGAWIYRVVFSATAIGPQDATDYLMLSRPVKAVVGAASAPGH
jgi:hypothetical protein